MHQANHHLKFHGMNHALRSGDLSAGQLHNYFLFGPFILTRHSFLDIPRLELHNYPTRMGNKNQLGTIWVHSDFYRLSHNFLKKMPAHCPNFQTGQILAVGQYFRAIKCNGTMIYCWAFHRGMVQQNRGMVRNQKILPV